MSHEMIKRQGKSDRDRVGELSGKDRIAVSNGTRARRERFLALLNYRYGYANDVAVDELKRFLKQFFATDSGLDIHRARANKGDLPGEEPD